ncbi:MAG: hypothetical protein KMY55_08320 [Dethiosulfatibacter sp.]|nr:hypothetical protein [Dethiosulfatibacter sp.]
MQALLFRHDLQGMWALAFYLLNAASLYKMAEKANLDNSWIAFIPFLQFILFFHLIDKSAWHVLLLLIPLVNIILYFVWSYELYINFGTDSTVAIILLLLGVFTGTLISDIFKIYLGFSESVEYVTVSSYSRY